MKGAWLNIVELLKSKKFKVTLFSIAALVCSGVAGEMTWNDVIQTSWPIVVAYLGAQGLADIGAYIGKAKDDPLLNK